MKFRNSLMLPVINKVIAILKHIIRQFFNVGNNNQKIKYAQIKEILTTSFTCSWLLLFFKELTLLLYYFLDTKSYF